VPAPGDDLAQAQHRRVRRQNSQLAARRRERKAAVERALELRHDLDRVFRHAAVLGAQGELGGPVA
jgi:hypothetical protein